MLGTLSWLLRPIVEGFLLLNGTFGRAFDESPDGFFLRRRYYGFCSTLMVGFYHRPEPNKPSERLCATWRLLALAAYFERKVVVY